MRILGWMLLAILAIILLAGLLIQTRPVKKKLTDFIEQQASGFINGNLTIDEIGGNFFTNLKLKNVLLTDETDTLAFIAEMNARYDLWPLLYGKLQIYSVQISHPSVNLKQVNDSTWNFQQIIKSTAEEPDSASVSSSKSFEFDLTLLKISEGAIKIAAADTLIPREIQHLNVELSLHWSDNQQAVRLNNFSLLTKTPDLELKQLAFKLNRNADVIELSNLYLKTAKNQLEGDAEYAQETNSQSTVNLHSSPLQLNEFEFFLPGLKIPATPVFKLDVSLQHDSLYATIDLTDQKQRLHLDLASSNLPGLLFNQTDSLLNYRLNGKLENIDLAYWSGNPQLNYLINGELTAVGKGIDPGTAVLTLNGNFNDCLIEKKPVDQLLFDVDLNRGNLSGLAQGHGNFGEFRLTPKIKNINGQPTYRFELITKKLDLARLTGNDSLQSNINLKANVNGTGFDPKTLFANATVVFSKSQLQQIQLDTLLSVIHYKNENLQIDSLWLQTQTLALNAHGNYSLKSNSAISLSATFTGLDEFASFFPVDDLQTSGRVDARLTGTIDSLSLETTIDLEQSNYADFSLERLLVNAHAKLTSADTLLHAHLLASKLRNDVFLLDSVAIDIEADPDSVFVNGRLANSDLESHLQTGIRLGEKMRLTLTEWIINYKNQHWALQQTPAVLEIDSMNYRINQFKLASGDSDSSQYILARGNISRNGTEDFDLKIANIDISQMAELFNQEVQASGLLNLNMKLSGTAESPVLKGDFGLNNAMLNQYQFTDFGGILGYQNDRLNIETNIVPLDSGKIELTGTIPLQLKLDSIRFNYNPKDSIDVLLTVERFPLAVLQTFNLTDEITGYLQGEITVTGTVESPDPKGNLQLINASVKIPEYGIDYRNIGFNMEFLRDKIKLDTFLIKTDDGKMTATGQIDFNSDFYKGDISQSQINIQFHEFNPVDHRQFNMQVSGNASLGGKKGDVIFDGDLNIPKAEIYLPAIFNMMGKVVTTEIPKPILVREMEQITNQLDTLAFGRIESNKTDSVNWDYFDHLTGKLRIKIPKNTWIKNEDMRIEISGDLELIKHEAFFEVFGSVDVIRGQYDLLGRTLVIDDGTINFQGGEEIMPEMNIKASYAFRNSQRVEQKLTVDITGTATAPAVSFTLDGSSINEGDALSYIIFGKSMNELTMDQQENLAGAGGGSLAETAAASILSSQITKFLGDKLDVDYIEIKSDGGFENATVVVGKYITNDLFVSYEQRFGETDEKDLAKYEVKLEYELFRFLFFQLNNSSNDSGFDVIFKFDSK